MVYHILSLALVVENMIFIHYSPIKHDFEIATFLECACTSRFEISYCPMQRLS